MEGKTGASAQGRTVVVYALLPTWIATCLADAAGGTRARHCLGDLDRGSAAEGLVRGVSEAAVVVDAEEEWMRKAGLRVAGGRRRRPRS